jgi:hypothetical protein
MAIIAIKTTLELGGFDPLKNLPNQKRQTGHFLPSATFDGRMW